MKRIAVLFVAVALLAVCAVHADYSVSDKGAWPESWPKELEPLRKRSSTIQGSQADLITHHIPFSSKEDFEAAWPHLLEVKTPGAPIILIRSPSKHWHFGETKAGVFIRSPSNYKSGPVGPNERATNVTERWMRTVYIELIVDGEIVDLNQLPFPAETPIIDQRFDERRYN